MKRKLLSVFLALSLCAGLIPTAALAAGDAPGCTCETACAEGAMNGDCPVCGMEGADLALCEGEAETAAPSDADPAITVESVQAMIDALPTADELRAMTKDEQNAVYADLQAAYEAYNKLTDEQKAEVTGAEMFDSLFEVFNSMVNALATVNGVSYLDEDGSKKTQDNVTVVESSTTTWNSGGWYVVNKDVAIDTRITVSGTVHLILADGYTLDAKSGIEVSNDNHLIIYAQSTGSSMGVLNATGSGEGTNSKAGIGGGPCGSVTINGGKITAKGSPRTNGMGTAGIGGNNLSGYVAGTITINGGEVTAIGEGYASGIGANVYGNNGGTINITGGYVIVKATGEMDNYDICALGSDGGADINLSGGVVITSRANSDGSDVRGNFSASGNGVIFADSFSSTDNSDSWNGVIFNGKSGKVYTTGDEKTITITDSFEIPSGYTLEIPDDVTLVIPEGVTLTNNGTISGGGKLTGGGQLDGSGSITVADNDFKPEAAVSVTISGEQVQDKTAPYGSTITITAAISEAEANALTRAAANQVEFFVGTGSTKRSLGTAYVSNNAATKQITLTSEDWKPGTYTITAEYGGSSSLKPASGTAQFTVTKAEQTGKPTVSVSETAVDSITVSASGDGQGGYEYACVPGANASASSEGWTTSGAFSDLAPGTAYTVFARFAGDEYYKPSPADSVTAYTLPEITTDTLDQAVVGVEYSETLTAQAAEGTKITWSLVSGSSLPEGLTLSEDGTISGTPKEAATDHKFTVQATANGVSTTKELSITVSKGTAVIDLDAPGEETREFTYGDTITVSGTITASSQALAANALTPLASNQAALFLGEKQLTQPVTVDEDGKFIITYATADKGIQATGQAQTLTVKYGGGDDLNEGSVDCSITLHKKPVTPQVQGEITKVYDGETDASVTLAFAEDDILDGDEVNVSAPNAAYDDEKAGMNKTITLGELTESGAQADFYDVKPPEGPIYGSITVSGSSLTAEAEKSELTYGDTLTITVTPTPTKQPPADMLLLDSRQGVELFYEDTSLAAADQPDENGDYTLTYDTAGKGIPIREGISLTVQFYGDGNMAASSTTATISLSAKPVTATVDTPVTKVYDKSKDISLTLSIADSDLENPDDEVVVTATGTFDDENAAPNKTVTVGKLTVKGGDAGWYMVTASAESVTGSITAAPITKPTIDASRGTKPGDKLEANYVPSSEESVEYQWNRDGQPIHDAKTPFYYIQSEDLGKEITVTVSAQSNDTNHVGRETSDSVIPSKGEQNAPPKPEEASVTTSSITVKEIEANQTTGAAVEFSINGGEHWQTSTAFDGLSSGSEYKIMARYQETDAYQASPTSEAVIRTTSPSGGDPSYSNKIEETEHGTVKVSHRTPEAGQKVTITPQPDEGYEVASVTVTKSGNKAVEVTDNGDGTWSFKQPSGKVTIRVEFREIEPEPVELPFIDVPADAWYIDGVRYVYEHHIMSGTSANTFNPSGIVNRGMIVQVLYNLAGQPKVEGGSGFDDVPGDFWCADAIAWASKLGVVNGYGDGTFGPNDNMTRDQMAVILFNYARAMGYDTSARGDLSGFTDIPENHWAGDALEWAYAEHLITGTSDTAMSPTGQASRAQIAVIMMRFCQRHVEK